MQDYLQHRITSKIVEGSTDYRDVETLWTFELIQGVWKVSMIEAGNLSLGYARMTKDLPKIEETLLPSQKTV
jgi:hypothetical protein